MCFFFILLDPHQHKDLAKSCGYVMSANGVWRSHTTTRYDQIHKRIAIGKKGDHPGFR